ncbi:hypothetical protein D3C73_659960 [compost metagenome]
MILISLSPNCFGLRLNAFFSAEHSNCSVQYTQGTLYLNGKVNVPRGINNINAVTFPSSGRSGGSNRNSTLLFLFHPVHRCCTFVHFTDFVYFTCIVKNPLCCCCLTSINMCHDPDITCIFQGELSCHGLCLLSIFESAFYQR